MTTVQISVSNDELFSWVSSSAVAVGLTVSGMSADCRVVDLAMCVRDPLLAADAGTVVVARSDDRDVEVHLSQCGVPELFFLPQGKHKLGERLRSFVPDVSGKRSADVLVITGTRGGAGSTTLAAGLSAAAADLGSVVFVDADPASAAVDINAGVDNDRGIRWTDLADVDGDLAVGSLQGRLPSTGEVDWLATPIGTANSLSWRSVMDALVNAYDTVVIDLPRYRLTATPPPTAAIPILLTTVEMTALEAARVLVDSGRFGADPLVATRAVGGPLRVSAANEVLSGARLRQLPSSRTVRGASDFGDIATAVAKGAFARACQRLLLEALR